jgi:adenylate cyclase
MRVVAANDPAFKVLTAGRAHSFCTHTIMDDKPLVIAHPEADVRVNYTKVATTLGARFYCGFPLVTDGDKVLGTLCCLDRKKHGLTESQFSAMQRLAHSTTKIIQVRGRQQQHHDRAVPP